MPSPRLTKLFIEAMAKHLPPSAATLRLLDVNGAAGETLSTLRTDLDVTVLNADAAKLSLPENTFDAVIAYDYTLNDDGTLLKGVLPALRPGGRLIVMETDGDMDEERVQVLENAGYTRILVETGIECPLPTGVLMRGEKPHLTDDTVARIQGVAEQDENAQTLADFKGRYVHLLVVQTPNKPVWALGEDEAIGWQAVTVNGALLAFSSLPKAVGFMQPAVITGKINGVNKVAKFSKKMAQTWTQPVLLNPTLDSLEGQTITLIEIDPSTAEKSDE